MSFTRNVLKKISIKKLSLVCLSIIILVFMVCGCSDAEKNDVDSKQPLMSLDDYPVTQGSNPTRIISERLFTHFTGLNDNDDDYYKIVHTGTSEAYIDFLDKDSDIEMIIAQQPDPEIEKELKNTSFKAIAKDALVFITDIDNPVDSLTIDQIKGILNGQITNWKEVGGKDEAINLIARNESGGSQILLDKYVLHGESIKDVPGKNIANGMDEMSKSVAEQTKNGSTLGYTTYYFAEYSGKRGDIKMLKIDGVIPGFDSISDQTYPIISQIYMGVRDIDSPAGEIFKWISTPEGQDLIKDTGYIPL